MKQSKVVVADSQGSQSDQSGLDLTTNIIDKVAWESNFSVKIPLNRRRYTTAHKGHATCVKYDRTGSSLVTGGEDACIRIWDARLGNQVSFERIIFYSIPFYFLLLITIGLAG